MPVLPPASPLRLRQVPEPVHPLHGAAGGAFDEIVDRAHDDDRVLVDGDADIAIIARNDVLQFRCARDELHERRIRIGRCENITQLLSADCLLCPGLNGRVYTARKRSGMRHEMNPRRHAGGRRTQFGDFRRVAVRERLVGVHIAVPLGVMRAVLRAATGARAAGGGGDEEVRFGEAGAQQRHDGKQYGSREATGMTDMGCRCAAAVFGHSAIKLRQQFRRAMRAAIDGFIVCLPCIAKVGRRIDHMQLQIFFRCRRQGRGDQRRGRAMRCGGKQRDVGAVIDLRQNSLQSR